MSGTYITTATRASPAAAYYAAAGSGGGGGATSTFQVASISSLTASTITAGTEVVTSVVANQVQSALLRGASIYSSTSSGTVAPGTSTLLFTVPNDGNGGGVFLVSAESDVAASGGMNIGTMFSSYTRASNGYSFGNVIATNNISSYDISPTYSISSSNPTTVYLANNGGNSLNYTAFLTRLGF